jgi:hypothetical protein
MHFSVGTTEAVTTRAEDYALLTYPALEHYTLSQNLVALWRLHRASGDGELLDYRKAIVV